MFVEGHPAGRSSRRVSGWGRRGCGIDAETLSGCHRAGPIRGPARTGPRAFEGSAAGGPENHRPAEERLHLDRLTIPDDQERIGEGSPTSVEVTEAYLPRILLLNPWLNSIIDIDHQALGQAGRATSDASTRIRAASSRHPGAAEDQSTRRA